jgi:hypothetical protein
MDYENKYASLSKEIVMELRKPKKYRTPCDLFCQRVMLEYNGLNEQAPDVMSIRNGSENQRLNEQR